MAWSFLVSAQQSDVYYRRLGGKSALTTERNEAAGCTAVSGKIPAVDLTAASNRVSHARGMLLLAPLVLVLLLPHRSGMTTTLCPSLPHPAVGPIKHKVACGKVAKCHLGHLHPSCKLSRVAFAFGALVHALCGPTIPTTQK